MPGTSISIGISLGSNGPSGPPRTNLALYSEQFDNAVWTPYLGPTALANAAVDPIGGNTADNEAFGAGPQELYQAITYAQAVAYTFSLYVMRNGGTDQNFRLKLTNPGTAYLYSSVLIATSAWQRFSFTATTTGTGAYPFGIVTDGTNAANLLVWGAQFETGNAATAYIGPTLGTAVTR